MTPFSPHVGKTVLINVSSSSQAVKVSDNPGPRQVRIMNDGTATIWVAFGNSSAVSSSTTANLPIAAGATEVLTAAIGDGPLYAAAIAAGATGKVYFTPGSGI